MMYKHQNKADSKPKKQTNSNYQTTMDLACLTPTEQKYWLGGVGRGGGGGGICL